MKFGAELDAKIHEPWRHAYLQYTDLKLQLKHQQLDHGWRDRDEKEFTAIFERELEKVYKFVDDKITEQRQRLEQCQETIKNTLSFEAAADILTDILFCVNDVSRFYHLNVQGFEKLVKKHDRYTHRDLKTAYVQMLSKWPLYKLQQKLDELVVCISDANDICRLQGRPRTKISTENEEEINEQTAFERATAKYWVHPDNITEVKSIILFHLPVHVYNKAKQYQAEDAAISSVYFDNPSFDLYSERLERSEGAEAIRFRWYGTDNKNVYVERKTHHAPWLNGHSVKDRFRLKEHSVNDFCKGRYTPEDLGRDLRDRKADESTIDQQQFVARGVQHSIQNRNLAPMCRVFYNRTAFQIPGDQRLRISLDCNMTFLREDSLDGKQRAGPSWRRTDVGIDYPFRNVDERDIHRFPYAVLETKIQSHLGQQVPEWLHQLLNSHLVYEVPRFSKYLHGASQLYADRVPVMPWWLEELDKDIRRSPSLGVGLSRSLSFQPLVNGHHRRSLLPPPPSEQHVSITLDSSEEKKPAKKEKSFASGNGDLLSRFYPANMLDISKRHLLFRNKQKQQDEEQATRRPAQRMVPLKKTEPKTFFANERTFISWLQFCALLLTVALNLLNTGDHISRIIGAVFIIMSSVLCL